MLASRDLKHVRFSLSKMRVKTEAGLALRGLLNLVMEFTFLVNGKPLKSQICGLERSRWLYEDHIKGSGPGDQLGDC